MMPSILLPVITDCATIIQLSNRVLYKDKYMKKIFCILLAVLALPASVLAQDEVEFTADRPGVGTGTGIVGKGKVMWEAGMAYDYEGGEKTFTFCNSLLRYGLTNNWEMRLELNGLHTWGDDFHTTGLDAVNLATKVRLYEGEDAVPSVALLTGLTLPVGSEAFRPSHIAPSLTLLADHDVTDRLNIAYNAGLEWDGETAAPTTFAALCLGYQLNDRLGAYIENYDYFAKGMKSQWNMDLGLNWMASRRVQLDVAGCFNLRHIKDSYGISFGVAWLIN